MKPLTSILTCFVFYLFLNPLSSQIPDNFEFLNHKFRTNDLGATKVYGDEIYYVNHIPLFLTSSGISDAGTKVYKVNGQNEPEIIFETFFTSESKIIDNSDASFEIILQEFVDYDFGITGFVSINVDANDVTIDTITRFSLDGNFNAGVLDDFFSFFDVDKTSEGNWIGTGSNEYFVFDETGIIDTIGYNGSNFYELINNVDQDLFGLSLNDLSSHTVVHRLSDEVLDSVMTIEFTDELQNLFNDATGNYLLSSNHLMQYSVDFTQLVNEWELTDFDGEISAINSHNDRIEILVESDRLYALLPDSEIILLSENLSTPDESTTFFQRIDSEQIIFGGLHDFESISENAYFRNINVIDNSNVEYDRIEIAFDNVELIRSNQEFNVNLDVINDGDEDVDEFNIYSRIFQPDAPINFWFFLDYSLINLPVNASVSLDTTTANSPMDDLSFVIPGGDYMFNTSPNGFWLGDISTSTFDISDSEPLTIYPNPSQDYIQLDTERTFFDITIYDELGRLVYFKGRNIQLHDKSVSVAHLDSGVYYVVVREDGEKHARRSRFVKE